MTKTIIFTYNRRCMLHNTLVMIHTFPVILSLAFSLLRLLQITVRLNSEIFRFNFNNLKEWSHIFRKNALSAFKSWMRTPPISCLYSKYKAAACRLLVQREDCQLPEAAALFKSKGSGICQATPLSLGNFYFNYSA